MTKFCPEIKYLFIYEYGYYQQLNSNRKDYALIRIRNY